MRVPGQSVYTGAVDWPVTVRWALTRALLVVAVAAALSRVRHG